ncbi:UDP-glucose 4-epimerase [Paenibacillus sp. A3]|uniref:SDR family NAD(P)-dependent oxidoreductase n=1 Tax=Paenibacillus sp. A3 TaxID=1337054 RepID=UPI0006D5745A|nr:SDR family NAD(P)-dependent oxidoreductase [Paenibacillus sp. A3]KPV57605.1 UDP-glucose 4-epimerase [Paenibacillus sp. A3]
MSKTVLVTGGAGFIGSHICEMYLKEGYETICIDNLVSGKRENISILEENSHFTFYKVDIRNYDELEEIFKKHQPKIINHHAAQKSVAYSVENPIYDLENNLFGLVNLLNLVKKYPIKNFIYVSSGGALSKEILGNEKSTEIDTPQLVSPYAITKFAGEKYLSIYSKEYNFNYTVLRYANVFGPRQIPDGECGVIPIFINNVLDDKGSILMTYPDMPRGCTRDYVYISDVVEANKLCTEKPVNTVINIGSGIEFEILGIYEDILEVFSKDLPIKITGPRSGDVKRSVLDCTLAKEKLGWEPQYTLKEGLKKLQDYLR